MERCSRFEICPMLNEVLDDRSKAKAGFVKRFCHGDYKACARLRAIEILGPGNVPNDLYPDQMSRLESLVTGP